jgi:hypothetical protein
MAIEVPVFENARLEPAKVPDWPDPHKDLTDHVGSRHCPPIPTVTRVRVVVTHHEVMISRNGGWFDRGDADVHIVRPPLIERLAIYVNCVPFGVQMVSGNSNHPLHKVFHAVATNCCHAGGRLKHHDVADIDCAKPDGQLVDDDPVALPERRVH